MSIYIIGDIHGSRQRLEEIISLNNISFCDNDTVILCGDAGFEYGDYIMDSLKKFIKKYYENVNWLVVRGNHDNRYWARHTHKNEKNKMVPNDEWHFSNLFCEVTLVQDKYPNIHYASDSWCIYYIEGKNFLTIPGAFSVDRNFRIYNSLPFEPKEQLTYKEIASLIDFAETTYDYIDYVVAHTFPFFLEPQIEDLFLEKLDQKSIDKNMEKALSVVMKNIQKSERFKKYFGGHFHDDRIMSENYVMLYNKAVKL